MKRGKKVAFVSVVIAALLIFLFLPFFTLVFESTNQGWCPSTSQWVGCGGPNGVHNVVGWASASGMVFGGGMVYFPSAHCGDFYLYFGWTSLSQDTPFPFTGSLCKP